MAGAHLEAARSKHSGLLTILGEQLGEQREALYGKYELLLDVMAVLRVELVAARGEPPEPTAMRPAIEAKYLRELAEKYPGVVERASRLDPLTYSDPQLAEACRCFLYGFYRATIVLSAVAVETALKANTTQGLPAKGMYAALVNAVFGPGGSRGDDRAQAGLLIDLFKTRNDVVHDEKEPDEYAARAILEQARAAIGRLVGEGT